MMKVIKLASNVTLHFFAFGQLKGLWLFFGSLHGTDFSSVRSEESGIPSWGVWATFGSGSVGVEPEIDVVGLELSLSTRQLNVVDERGLGARVCSNAIFFGANCGFFSMLQRCSSSKQNNRRRSEERRSIDTRCASTRDLRMT
jgi:hypothetical protein